MVRKLLRLLVCLARDLTDSLIILAFRYPATLASIVQFVTSRWSSYVVFDSSGRGIAHNEGVTTEFTTPVYPDICPSYSDPLEHVLQSMNELMFYLGAILPPMYINGGPSFEEYYREGLDAGQTPNATTLADPVGRQEIFETNLHWFIAAAVIEVVCVALILPSYMGFWKLGRHVSLSPLEIAKVSRLHTM